MLYNENPSFKKKDNSHALTEGLIKESEQENFNITINSIWKFYWKCDTNIELLLKISY